MAHIGIERLTSGNTEDDRGQSADAVQMIHGKKIDRIQGIYGGKDSGLMENRSET